MLNAVERIELNACKKADMNSREVIARALISLLFEDSVNYETTYHAIKSDKTGLTLGCGCAYCQALYKYAGLKRLQHRIKKRSLADDSNFMGNSYIDEQLMEYYKIRLSELEITINMLKIKKDDLKIKLNL